MPAEPNFIGMLEVLTRHRVRFVVVGGIAAVLHGAPIMTADLDVVYDTEPGNVERLLGALRELEAQYRDPAGRRILPDTEKLTTFRLSLLSTKLGPLDALRTIGDGLGYPDLVAGAEEYEVADLRVLVAGLDTLIVSKEHADRPKDRATLPILRQVLETKKTDRKD
jgi:hypothetical protein